MDLMLCINSTYEIRMWDRVRHLHRAIWGDGISQITLQSRISFGMHPSLAQAELILSYVVSVYMKCGMFISSDWFDNASWYM